MTQGVAKDFVEERSSVRPLQYRSKSAHPVLMCHLGPWLGRRLNMLAQHAFCNAGLPTVGQAG